MATQTLEAVLAAVRASGGQVDELEQLGGLLHLEVVVTNAGPLLDAVTIAAAADTTVSVRATRSGESRVTIDITVAPQEQVRTAVRLPLPLRDKVHAERNQTGVRPGDILMQELNRPDTALDDLLASSRRQHGLPPGAPRRRRDTLTTPVWINITTSELARLDRAAARWTSGNRSAVATRLLEGRYRRPTPDVP